MKRKDYQKPTMQVAMLQQQAALMQFGHSGSGNGGNGFSDTGLGGRSGYGNGGDGFGDTGLGGRSGYGDGGDGFD